MTPRPEVMISGLPGKMATLVAETVLKHVEVDKMNLANEALTGSDQPEKIYVNYCNFFLIHPEHHDSVLGKLRRINSNLIIVDFTEPTVVNRNAELYCKHGIPFVMGTTGGDRKALEQVVVDSGNMAVIAPNMAAPIVALQSFMEDYAMQHKDALKGCTLTPTESHQAGKKDTSGTMKAMLQYFQALGCDIEKLTMIREPDKQRKLGIPEEHLQGHGWHWYLISTEKATEITEASFGIDLVYDFLTKCQSVPNSISDGITTFRDHAPLIPEIREAIVNSNMDYTVCARTSIDRTVYLAGGQTIPKKASDKVSMFMIHNINGRQVYADGTIDALKFLDARIREGVTRKVYSMIDVLKAGGK